MIDRAVLDRSQEFRRAVPQSSKGSQMSDNLAQQRAETFHRLHSGPEVLVLPGVWDVASARVFAVEGFSAIGTTSSGVAWTLGYGAGQEAEWSAFLEGCRRIAQAVDVPVTFDLEAGFGTRADVVAQRVQEAIEAGACGINLEDGLKDGALVDTSVLEEKVHAIRERCAKLEYPLYVNARTDVYLGGVQDVSQQLAEAVARGQRYAAAGADGFFVPGVTEPGAIATIVKEVPLPLNVYALPGVPAAEELQSLGVRRVSLGCGPLQAVLAQTRDIARHVKQDGDWRSFSDHWLSHADAASVCSGVST